MSWQRRARWLAAAAGVSCAVVLYVLLSDPREPAADAPTLERPDPEATHLTAEGELRQYKGDRLDWLLTYAASRSYDDGRARFDQPQLTFDDQDAGSIEIRAGRAETRGEAGARPAEVVFEERVRVRTADGLELAADRAVYADADGRLTMPGRVTFARGRMAGESVGAEYFRTGGVLQLLDQARVVVVPDAAGTGRLAASGRTMAVTRPERKVALGEGASIERDRETLTAAAATLFFTDDEQGLRRVELRGQAAVVPRDEAAAAPEMRAEDIDLTFHADGATLEHATLRGRGVLGLGAAGARRSVSGGFVAVRLAPDGETVTRLEARDRVAVRLPASAEAPARTIAAAALVAQGDDRQGLTAALFEGGVEFVESRAAGRGAAADTRTGRSRSLALVLKGDLDRIDQAEFRDDVTFRSGEVSGTADRGRYFADRGDLWLEALERSRRPPPHAETAAMSVDAASIRLNIDSSDLEAAGDVRTVSRPGPPGTRRPATGLFDADKPVYGVAAELRYTSRGGRAVYTGRAAPARVWQDQNQITGDVVEVEEETSNLRAAGRVQSRFHLAGEAGGAMSEYRVQAVAMTYEDAARRAIYTGGADQPAGLTSREGQIDAARIELWLRREARELERMVASGGVAARLEGRREVGGDTLTYVAATGRYVVTGQPATVKAPRTDGPDCTKWTARTLTFQRGTETVEADGGGALAQQTVVPCGTGGR